MKIKKQNNPCSLVGKLIFKMKILSTVIYRTVHSKGRNILKQTNPFSKGKNPNHWGKMEAYVSITHQLYRIFTFILFLLFFKYSCLHFPPTTKKEPLPFTTAWMGLESIMLSEISQEVKDKYHISFEFQLHRCFLIYKSGLSFYMLLLYPKGLFSIASFADIRMSSLSKLTLY